MITNIDIQNFKSLKDISMRTCPLNILMGLNGMGKSSFMQILLLLKQSKDLYERELQLDGTLTNIGKGKDALYQFAEDERIKLGITLNDSEKFHWDFNVDSELEKLIAPIGYKKETLNHLLSELSKFQYLSADRLAPMDVYDTQKSVISRNEIGERGEYTAHFLNVYGNKLKVNEKLKSEHSSDLSLINQVNGWLSTISPGVLLNVIEVPLLDKILLSYEFLLKNGRKTTGFRPKNVGFGISYVLPVITALLLPEKGKIILIENPESHIHPKGQAELGRLMALSAANGAQIFVETHSDHIINGIRVAVKEGLINKNDVNISYFDKVTTESEQYTRITPIHVDPRGELSDYPIDFMDEWNNQLLKLI